MRFLLGMMLTSNGCDPEKPFVVLLMGPPGSGKGTHAKPLGNHFGVPHISTGDLFRENVRSQTPLGLQAKTYIDRGKLVPDEIVLEMLLARLSLPDCRRGYILDGFPRTTLQAQALDQKLKNSQIIVVHLNVPDVLLVERISGRLACQDCGQTYHKKYTPPLRASQCDTCRGLLYQRDDDREEILKKRLEIYRAQTEPLIQYYSRQKNALREVDATHLPDEVFSLVLDALGCLASSTYALFNEEEI